MPNICGCGSSCSTGCITGCKDTCGSSCSDQNSSKSTTRINRITIPTIVKNTINNEQINSFMSRGV